MFIIIPLIIYIYIIIYVLAILSYFIFSDILLIWFVIEINMMIFIGLTYINDSNNIPFIMNYFLIQSYASFMMLMSIVFMRVDSLYFVSYLLIQISVFINLAIFPFSSWFYPVATNTSVIILFFILVLQNWPVLIINFNYLYLFDYNSVSSYLSITIIFLLFSMLFSAIGSISSSGLISLIVWSSLINSVWLYLSTYTNIFVVLLYFVLYFFSVGVVFIGYSFYNGLHNQLQGLLFFNLIGLPPLPMFFVKLSIVNLLILIYGYSVVYFILLGMVLAVIMIVAYTRYYLFVTIYELQNNFSFIVN